MSEDKNNQSTDSIKEYGLITAHDKFNISCLTIIGQIEGHFLLPNDNKTTKYEHVIPQIIEVEENPETDGLLIVLNTVGGDVEAGLAIAELISGMKKPTVSLVLGGGHSIGVPLAVSTDVSLIVPSATMTIHPIRTNGLVLGVPQTLHNLLKMQERITSFVVRNSNISEEDFLTLLMNTKELPTDVGSILDGQKAVEYGLINKIGGIEDAFNELNKLIEKQKGDNNGCNENKKQGNNK